MVKQVWRWRFLFIFFAFVYISLSTFTGMREESLFVMSHSVRWNNNQVVITSSRQILPPLQLESVEVLEDKKEKKSEKQTSIDMTVKLFSLIERCLI